MEMLHSQGPIGVFDSGLGGLSVWRHLAALLPQESFIYMADSAHCPYGTRPAEEIVQLSRQLTETLLSQGAKLIVVACNTATAAAITALRQQYPQVQFVGMEPAVKPAALQTRSGHIGVLATAGTLKGRHFHQTLQAYAQHITVHTQVGEGLVEIVEQGHLHTPEAEALLRRYVEPMLAAGIDQLVLGCTHYPFLMPLLERIIGTQPVQIIDPAGAVAKRTQQCLHTQNLATSSTTLPQYRFLTTGSAQGLALFLEQWQLLPLGHVPSIQSVDLDPLGYTKIHKI